MAAREFENNVKEQLEKIQKCKGDKLLSMYLKLYMEYRQEANSIHRIFAYLHRFWIPNQRNAGEKVLQDDDKVREVYQLALVQWRKYCFGSYADQLRAASLGLLDDERDGQQIDRNLVKNFVDLLNDLQVDQGITFYENHFEKQCLLKTKEYYLKVTQRSLLLLLLLLVGMAGPTLTCRPAVGVQRLSADGHRVGLHAKGREPHPQGGGERRVLLPAHDQVEAEAGTGRGGEISRRAINAAAAVCSHSVRALVR